MGGELIDNRFVVAWSKMKEQEVEVHHRTMHAEMESLAPEHIEVLGMMIRWAVEVKQEEIRINQTKKKKIQRIERIINAKDGVMA